MKYLIVTADDLGLAKSINEGISKAYSEGIVRSVSVIPSGEAFDDAILTMKNLRLKEIGAHLSLTETKPLLGSSRYYKDHNKLFMDLSFNRVDLDAVYKELKSQLQLLKNAGFRITHINSHEHIHMIPRILDIFISLAKEFGVPAIRYPRHDRPSKLFAISDIYKKVVLSYFSGATKDIFKNSGLLYTDSFLGLLDAGRLKENMLIDMIKNIKDGTTELVCHPGFLSPRVLDGYRWHIGAEEELFALTGERIKKEIKDNDIQLATYGELSSIIA